MKLAHTETHTIQISRHQDVNQYFQKFLPEIYTVFVDVKKKTLRRDVLKSSPGAGDGPTCLATMASAAPPRRYLRVFLCMSSSVMPW